MAIGKNIELVIKMASYNFKNRDSDEDNLDESDDEEKQEKQSDLKRICKELELKY